MLPAKRAGVRGADPWHAMHRETVTKLEVKQVEQLMHRETATKVVAKQVEQPLRCETATKVVAKRV